MLRPYKVLSIFRDNLLANLVLNQLLNALLTVILYFKTEPVTFQCGSVSFTYRFKGCIPRLCLFLESRGQALNRLDDCIELGFDSMKQIQGHDDRESYLADKRNQLFHLCSSFWVYFTKKAGP